MRLDSLPGAPSPSPSSGGTPGGSSDAASLMVSASSVAASARQPISLRQLPGRLVLAVDRGEAVGYVLQPLFSASSLRLDGLLLEPATPATTPSPSAATPSHSPAGRGARWFLLSLTDLVAVGPEAVTVPSRLHLHTVTERPALASLIDWSALPAGPDSPTHRRWHFPFWGKFGSAGLPPCDAPSSLPARPAAQPAWSDLFSLPILTDQGEHLGTLDDILVERVGGRLVRILYRPPGWWARWKAPLAMGSSQIRTIGPDACVVTTPEAPFPPPTER
ncbi:MAG: PRC-barrel domain-containing protein [Limnochordaceae bacterium]|nr:PRC-barrel domain-containing protein [Limnochordaceae bacterium]